MQIKNWDCDETKFSVCWITALCPRTPQRRVRDLVDGVAAASPRPRHAQHLEYPDPPVLDSPESPRSLVQGQQQVGGGRGRGTSSPSPSYHHLRKLEVAVAAVHLSHVSSLPPSSCLANIHLYLASGEHKPHKDPIERKLPPV